MSKDARSDYLAKKYGEIDKNIIYQVDIEDIIRAPYNPVNRVRKQSLRGLEKEIVEQDILSPLTLTKEFELCDGHRRLECAINLGYQKVPCRILGIDRDRGYMSLNSDSKPINQKDALQIYVQGGPTLPKLQKPLNIVLSLIGKEGIDEISSKKKSVEYVVQTMQVLMPYLGITNWKSGDNKLANKSAQWMVRNDIYNQIRHAITVRMEQDFIIYLINSNAPITEEMINDFINRREMERV
jgi:hypothetical protein